LFYNDYLQISDTVYSILLLAKENPPKRTGPINFCNSEIWKFARFLKIKSREDRNLIKKRGRSKHNEEVQKACDDISKNLPTFLIN